MGKLLCKMSADCLGQSHGEAESPLSAGYKGMRPREDQIPVCSKTRLTEALQRLVDLYVARNKPDEAAHRKSKLFELEAVGVRPGDDGSKPTPPADPDAK